jgi:hypothetical protein
MVYDVAHGFPSVPLPSAATLRTIVLLADMVIPSPCSSQLRASCELCLQMKVACRFRIEGSLQGRGVFGRRSLQRGYSLNGDESSHTNYYFSESCKKVEKCWWLTCSTSKNCCSEQRFCENSWTMTSLSRSRNLGLRFMQTTHFPFSDATNIR